MSLLPLLLFACGRPSSPQVEVQPEPELRYRYDAKAQVLEEKARLEVNDISALAIEGDRLLVLDGSSGKLVSLPLAGLN